METINKHNYSLSYYKFKIIILLHNNSSPYILNSSQIKIIKGKLIYKKIILLFIHYDINYIIY